MRPTICLNMIVKDEENVIKNCLESVKPYIDYWVISDTGSSDRTREIVLETLKDIPGELFDEPWQNFGYNRNEVLKKSLGKADYHLIIDADETFHVENRGSLDAELHKGVDHCLGSIRYSDKTFSFLRPMLLRDKCVWEYKGVVHNYVQSAQARTQTVLESVYIVHHHGGARPHNEEKFKLNAELLKAELEKDPSDTRSAFYLGESYRDAGMKEEAIAAYMHRASMGGWPEEVFWSLFQKACLTDEAVDYFVAYEYRPIRVEPLYALAESFRKKNMFRSALSVLETALEVPIPEQDTLFLNTALYEWGIMDLHASLLVNTGHVEAGLSNMQWILENRTLPEEHIKRIKDNIASVHVAVAQQKSLEPIKLPEQPKVVIDEESLVNTAAEVTASESSLTNRLGT